MSEFVTYRGPGGRAGVVAAVRRAVRGAVRDRPDVAEQALLPGAVALLGKVHAAFLAKSRGGTDEAGIRWAPLTRATVARRPIGPGDLSAIGVKGTRIPADRTRGLLTPAQDRRWRSIFASRLAHFRAAGLPDGEAKARAARIAWAVLKQEGAKTKLDVLGGRQVDIGRNTGLLLRSLTPGVRAPESVRRVEPGRITVGSNVSYAARFHARRPLWPTGDPAALPDPWTRAVAGAVAGGLLRAVAAAMEAGRV